VKRFLFVAFCLLVTAGSVVYVWARAALSGEAVRSGIERQLSQALAQPVTIRAARATIWPRVTLRLDDVAIGNPATITIRQLDVGADLGALVSRRVEHGALRAAGARITLPLPAFTLSRAETPAAQQRPPPVKIVSIDAIRLDDVEIVSGGRSLRGDVDVLPTGAGLEVNRISLRAEQTELSVYGTIANLTGPTGSLTVKAPGLNLPEVVAFVSDFARGAGITAPGGQRGVDRYPMNLQIDVDAGRTVAGTLVLDRLNGVATVTPGAIVLNPVTFGVFGGGYTGTLRLTLGSTASYSLNAALKNVDVAKAMAFAGSQNTMTGQLNGSLVVSGRGIAADDVVRSARGTARLDVTDGTLAGLDLVRAIVLATSGRADSPGLKPLRDRSGFEPFSRLGGSFTIADNVARTSDLRLESKDVVLAGAGDIHLLETAVALKGLVQLSPELSKQAGPDLVRYASQDGRVTLPVTVTGPAGQFTVTPDLAEAARRAISKELSEGLKSLFKKIIK
jgi:uncharacterized protein involved in outer membrane biogenesis